MLWVSVRDSRTHYFLATLRLGPHLQEWQTFYLGAQLRSKVTLISSFPFFPLHIHSPRLVGSSPLDL